MDKMKRMKKNVLWTLGLAGIFMLLVMSINRKQSSTITKLVVIIKPIKGDKNLINDAEVVLNLRKFLGYDIRSAKINDINTIELENLIKSDQRVKSAEVYLDSKNRLNVWIIQRQPVVRIVDDRNVSYYIDDEGAKISTRRGQAVRVPVATGYIDLYDEAVFKSDKKSVLKEVYKTAKLIMEDDFASALIEQIDVDTNKDISLIPKIGRQRIIIGNADDLPYKLNSLKTMYKEGIPMVGWQKYRGINLKYKGQVIGEF